jgi:NDP-sugar pyrophosphorylase family protein
MIKSKSVQDSMVSEDVKIGENVHIFKSLIGKNCKIFPTSFRLFFIFSTIFIFFQFLNEQ